MGTSMKANTHLYIDEQNRVRIVIEYVDGKARLLKTDRGEPCEAAATGNLGRLKIVRTGALLRHITGGISSAR